MFGRIRRNAFQIMFVGRRVNMTKHEFSEEYIVRREARKNAEFGSTC
jgi:hypothetical protein